MLFSLWSSGPKTSVENLTFEPPRKRPAGRIYTERRPDDQEFPIAVPAANDLVGTLLIRDTNLLHGIPDFWAFQRE